MRCEKCKYNTKTTCQCHFGYEQASKEFVDGNCEKFIDKYKEEYTPIIAKQIIEEIHKEIELALDSNYKARNNNGYGEFREYVNGKIHALRGIQDFLAELKKKYIGE